MNFCFALRLLRQEKDRLALTIVFHWSFWLREKKLPKLVGMEYLRSWQSFLRIYKALLPGLRICRLYPLHRGKTPTPKIWVFWILHKTTSALVLETWKVEYLITARTTLNQRLDLLVPSMAQINWLKKYLYSIKPYAKKKKKNLNNYEENVNMDR